MNPKTIAILGPGLLGGSLALAVRRIMPDADVRVWARRAEAADEVCKMNLASLATTSVADAVTGATLVILATPIGVMTDLAAQIARCDVAAGCIVTDVGSVKVPVVSALEPLFAGTRAEFIGSHPMAGSEKTGIASARGDLFQGAACFVTPTEKTSGLVVQQTMAFWKQLGCRIIRRSPEEHDRLVARISHLPHLLAVLTTLAALEKDPTALEGSANGFRDTTRVAAGDPDLWTGILLGNRDEVVNALRDASDRMRDVLEMLEGMDEEALRLFLARAKTLRDQLPAAP